VTAGTKIAFVVDANVLIDYANADLTVLSILSREIGPVFVPDAVLDKVDQLDRNDCDQLAIRVAEPSLEQLLDAGQRRGRLAFDDSLCLILARDNGWICTTNDKALRSECAKIGVDVQWGLQLLIALVEKGELMVEDAESIASAIHETNPAFVTREILNTFKEKVRRIQEERIF